MPLYPYLPQDRLRAIANNISLPDRTSGSALFSDISGFTALTESLREKFGSRQGAEELTKQLGKVHLSILAYLDGSLPSLRFGDLRQAKVNAFPLASLGDDVRGLQSASGDELRPFFRRTLMPSILDKAFKEDL